MGWYVRNPNFGRNPFVTFLLNALYILHYHIFTRHYTYYKIHQYSNVLQQDFNLYEHKNKCPREKNNFGGDFLK